MDKAFDRIKAGLEDAIGYAEGDTQGRRVHSTEAPAVDVRAIREKLKLSQHAFAGLLGVSVRTVQDWEQARRVPRGPAMTLLRIADQHPEVFLQVR